MSKRTRHKITLDGPWVAVSRAQDDTAARNYELSTDLRLLGAARSRLELGGHSHFNRRELRTILAKVNRRTGELAPLSASALTRRIGALVDAGLLAHGSWSECLVVPPFSVQTGERYAETTGCPKRPAGRSQNLAA
ncbi:hypothetical protein ACFWE5_05450 [Cellulosimicrobium funkei]|uniref:hypothetical protein n=1 Tax=Cellulosimicrobium funkei TaxID=264251 RepID=UPI0036555D7F